MIYKIILESIGQITLLPDSQKLFGFLMSKLSEHFTDDEVSAFVDAVREDKIKCMVSNLLPEGYIPFPKSYILDKVSNNSEEIYKLIKEMDYVDEKSLKSIVKSFNCYNKNGDSIAELKNIEELEKAIGSEMSFISVKQKYVQKFKLESQEKSIPGLPNRAYSLQVLECYLNKKDLKNEKYDEFSFFVEVEAKSILASYIEKLSKNNNEEIIYGLGSKVSHGYNSYKFKNIEKSDYENKNNGKNSLLINIGMLIPRIENIDENGSFLDIYASNRKSYEISDNVEKVISFIAPGSVINIKDKDKDVNVGRCIRNKYNLLHNNAIIFGNSFIKRLEVN